MVVMPGIMMIIRKFRMIRNVVQECPPSIGMFLMALIATNINVSYIFGILS